jgi:DNA adenine methylase
MGDGVPKQMPMVGAGRDQGTTIQGIQALRHNGVYNMDSPLKAPLPYHGGKSTVADAVWARLGDTSNYVEPFMGSAAVLLARPHDLAGKTETINDIDGFLTCAYRAIAYAPEETAYWCDRPVNECDLTAFHLWLKAQRPDLTERLFADPFYYDPVVAGAFLWGAASWIGDGWCVADGPWIAVDGKLCDRRTLPKEEQEEGVEKKMPVVSADGDGYPNRPGIQRYRDAPGVEKKAPAVSPQGGGTTRHQGVQAYRYRDAPGVPKKMPEVGYKEGMVNVPGRGVHASQYTAPAALLAYFERLATRLRRVRILCGDWRRVVKPSITTNHGLTALFMDSEYPADEHDMTYHQGKKEAGQPHIWYQVAQWAVENGDNPLLRICVAGYFSEKSDSMFPASWERYRWEARGGYSNQSADGRGRANAKRECLWFNQNCLNPSEEARASFDRPITVRASDYTGTLFEEGV